MGQRINIQYSIDMEELPEEMLRMVNGAMEKLRNLPAPLSGGGQVLSLETIEEIDSVRQRLADVDHALRDASAIVASYVSFKAQSSQPMEENVDPSVLREFLEREQADEGST